MVVFMKNGQGKWDFDFEVLVELTTREMADDVRGALEMNEGYVYDVCFSQTDIATCVSMVTIASIMSFTYFPKEGEYFKNYMNIGVVRRHFPCIRESFEEMGGF